MGYNPQYPGPRNSDNSDVFTLDIIDPAPTDTVLIITTKGTFRTTVAQLAGGGTGGSGGGGLTGHGSPEGVVTADVGKIYFDLDGDGFYYKKTGSGNTGWQAIAL